MRRSLPVFALVGMALLVLAGCAGSQAASPIPTPTSEVPAAAGPSASGGTAPVDVSRGAQPLARSFPTRVSDAGQVVVEVTPRNLDRSEGALQFEIAMNTHSVELDYDLAQLAVLRTDRGDEVNASRWEGDQGGHHVAGNLDFPAVNLDGAQWVEIVIRDVGGAPERAFRWELR